MKKRSSHKKNEQAEVDLDELYYREEHDSDEEGEEEDVEQTRKDHGRNAKYMVGKKQHHHK